MLKSFIKQYFGLFIILIILGSGSWYYLKNNAFVSNKSENTTIILEKIKTVTKLISVEGQFS